MQFSCSVKKKKKSGPNRTELGIRKQGNKKYDLMGKKRMIGAKKIAGIGVRG